MDDLSPTASTGAAVSAGREIRLSQARPGERGVIAAVHVRPDVDHHGLPAEELERRLLELGFVEGASVEVIHEGLIGGDPMAVRLDDMRVALRRRDAAEITVRLSPEAAR